MNDKIILNIGLIYPNLVLFENNPLKAWAKKTVELYQLTLNLGKVEIFMYRRTSVDSTNYHTVHYLKDNSEYK